MTTKTPAPAQPNNGAESDDSAGYMDDPTKKYCGKTSEEWDIAARGVFAIHSVFAIFKDRKRFPKFDMLRTINLLEGAKRVFMEEIIMCEAMINSIAEQALAKEQKEGERDYK
jgi:hypothetical protein